MAYGNHFQDLFSKLMKEKYGIQYQPTSSYGNIGDMCVDGVLDYSTAFAVYAPEIYNDNKTIRKLTSDFNGFMHKKNGMWRDIQTYIFVIKRERAGITPSVLGIIEEFRKDFPVEIMTMDDLEKLEKGYLPFSEDGRKLLEFKEDVTKVMEYIIKTDFAAGPFCMSLWDNIETAIEKWNRKQYSFNEEKMEDIKNRIISSLSDLCNYLTPLYVRALPNGLLLFNNNSGEAGERLRNEMQPQIRRIRHEVNDLLNELYSIK